MELVTLVYQAPGGAQPQEVPAYLSENGRLHLPSVRNDFGLQSLRLNGVLVPGDATYSPATYEPGARIQVSGSIQLQTERQLAAGAPSSGQAGAGAAAGMTTEAETAIHAAAATGAQILTEVLDIKRKVTEASEATRHASTIAPQDLDALEAALRICFVPYMEDALDEAASASYSDPTEFKWEDNKHEAKHRAENLQCIAQQVSLPRHLSFSASVDKASTLSTSMHAGGASLPFSVGCRTDAMLVACRAPFDAEGSIVCTIELKNQVVAQSLRQTKATFMCASLKSQLPVISCCTDMQNGAVAFYTTGQKRSDNVSIVIEHFFKDSQQMFQWLGTALSAQSVAPNVLQMAEDGNIVIPKELPNPKRVRLPVPKPPSINHDAMTKMLARVLYEDEDDVACLRDVEEVPYLSYFS